MANPIESFNRKTFTEQLSTRFILPQLNHAPLELELVEVNEPPTTPKVELFSLLFRGPKMPRLNQGIHAMEHAALGKFELFLTPIGADHESTTYEVIFHRLRKDQQ